MLLSLCAWIETIEAAFESYPIVPARTVWSWGGPLLGGLYS